MARQGRLAARGVEGAVSLPRRARKSDRGSGEARADRGARDPACLEGRLDLAARRREAPGDRRRRRRAAPVPLPPGLPRAAGAGEVRQARPLRRAAAGPAARRWRAHGARTVRPRARLRGRAAADQPRLVPRRLRPLRADIADVRDHDALTRHVTVRGNRITFRFRAKHRVQVRTTVVDAELADAIKELLAQPGGARVFRYACERRVVQPHRRGPQRLHPGAPRRGVHGQGLPHLGRDADGRDRARRARRRRDRGGGEDGRSRT